jgi:carbamoyltransferase
MAIQLVLEDIVLIMAATARRLTGAEYLCMAGGVALNCVANSKILKSGLFQDVFIQPAAGDAGGALGAALAYRGVMSEEREVDFNPYLGPAYTNTEVLKALQESGLVYNELPDVELFAEVAKASADGKIIGIFNGGMEWGPRALGNRSILGDPRRADMKDILNLKIKRRESFRPFAPSIMREYVTEWFEQDDDVPFMMEVFQVKADKRAQVPATTHVDGSGRLQTVHKETNPRYHRLIDSYRQITGVPIVLNTSFNENEPVVCKPQEALDCFLRTKMDVLVLNDWIVTR